MTFFQFQHPWLLALLAFPVLAALHHFIRKPWLRSAVRYSRASALPALFRASGGTGIDFVAHAPAALRLVTLALMVVALARPQMGTVMTPHTTRGTDILLCLDTSTSMKSEDFAPRNRMDAAKSAAVDFVRSRRLDRIGVAVFAGVSYTQCPLTLDYGALLEFLDHVQIGMTGVDGTAVGNGLVTAINRLKDSKAKSRLIILLTDGRNNTGEIDPLTAAKMAKALDIKVYTIGCGAVGGGYITVNTLLGPRRVQYSEDLDEGTLKEIAALTKGEYFRATDTEGLKKIFAQIDRMEKTEIKVERLTRVREVFHWLLYPALLLFLLELFLVKTVLRRVP